MEREKENRKGRGGKNIREGDGALSDLVFLTWAALQGDGFFGSRMVDQILKRKTGETEEIILMRTKEVRKRKEKRRSLGGEGKGEREGHAERKEDERGGEEREESSR